MKCMVTSWCLYWLQLATGNWLFVGSRVLYVLVILQVIKHEVYGDKLQLVKHEVYVHS